MIRRILIANRGEIALRIIRTCKEMGIETISIYTKSDQNALHVKFSTIAAPLFTKDEEEGSYLSIEKIMEIAKHFNVDAIHPGYGFLSENFLFAEECEKRGVIFIGPSAETISKLGNKTESRRLVKKSGFPIIKGINSHIIRYPYAKQIASIIGYPVMIKAVLGGGGKGMRIVHSEETLKESYDSAAREAQLSFGDNKLYMEKYVANPRHIEVQVFADSHKNIVHLFARDCSMQRRHQKLIEEAGELVLSFKESKKLCNMAVEIAKLFNYRGAGTVEFLMDKDRDFYFMEFNARIQVEYPVTELVSGVDLIKEQITVARGEKLSVRQEDIKKLGHAIECRVNTENPRKNFFPEVGTIEAMHLPGGAHVRVDHALYNGQEISTNFDSMIAKLITFGKTRKEAIQKMRGALEEFSLTGIKATTIDLFKEIFQDELFINNDFDTSYLDKFKFTDQVNEEDHRNVAIMAALIYSSEIEKTPSSALLPKKSNWKRTSLRRALGV